MSSLQNKYSLGPKFGPAILCVLLLAFFAFAAVDLGTIITVAGTGQPGFEGDNAAAIDAKLNLPMGLAVSEENHLFIADGGNRRIRRVDGTTGIITTIAGNGPFGLTADNIPATDANISFPVSPVLDAEGNLFFADRDGHRVRRVDAATGTITTVAGNAFFGFSGDSGPATDARLASPRGVAVDSAGNVFIADSMNNRIRRVDAATGIITTVAGNGASGFSGDNGPATDARLAFPQGVALDADDNLFIADSSNRRVRRVDAATGVISTVAGNGSFGFSGDGGPAVDAGFSLPIAVAVDNAGNLLIADPSTERIRRVDGLTGIITTVAGNGFFGSSGDNGAATEAGLGFPQGITADTQGNLYIADTFNYRIRFVQLADPDADPTESDPANQAPVADAGPDQTAECAGPSGSTVTLDGSASSDPDGDPLSFEWKDGNGSVVASTATTTITLPLGTHTFTLTVDDGRGGTASDSVTVTVQDTTPPALSVSFSPSVLWPANHKLVVVSAQVAVSDACDPNPTVTLISIYSNEPDNGLGDGDTSGDVQDAEFGSDDRSFLLRAERQATGLGRLYTITYQAVDASGNLTEVTEQVLVPHSKGNSASRKKDH